MDNSDIWTNEYAAAVCVLAAILWHLPPLQHSAWRKVLGLTLVALAGVVGLVLGDPLTASLPAAALGLGASWVAVDAKDALLIARRKAGPTGAAVALVVASIASPSLTGCAHAPAALSEAQAVLGAVQVYASGSASLSSGASAEYVVVHTGGEGRLSLHVRPWGEVWALCYPAESAACRERDERASGPGPWAYRIMLGGEGDREWVQLVAVPIGEALAALPGMTSQDAPPRSSLAAGVAEDALQADSPRIQFGSPPPPPPPTEK